MKRIILGFLLVFTAHSAIAQTSGSGEKALVEGTVYNEDGESVLNASVAIYDSTQSNLVTGASSDTTGAFSVDVKPGNYVVRISYVSYNTYTESVDLAAGETYNVGEVTLSPRSEEMGEVMVRAEQSSMQMNFDSRTFDVGQDLTSMGGSALNVLDNVPSIATDIDGNISLRGNQSVRILINGRPSNLVNDGADGLRSIPSYLIKEVEIITNPSAKYSAEGSAGIINIIMKKDQREGFNGSVGVGSGLPQDHEMSTNLNYRTENVNWFMGGGVDYRSDPEEGYSYQEFNIGQTSDADTSYAYRENTDADESEVDGDLRLGADFFLTDRQTLTLDANGEIEDGWSNEQVNYIDYQINSNGNVGDLMREIRRIDDQDEMGKEFEVNLEYENRIEGQSHRLTAEASFDMGNESERSNFSERVLEGTYDPQRERTISEESSQDFRFEADYVRPLGEGGELEAGARSTFDRMDNSYRAEVFENNSWQPLQAAEFNDNFRYLENINAVYATLSKQFGAFSTSFGLRAEHTVIETELKTTGQKTNQNYIGLFPSVFLNYSFNDRQSVQVSYSRRLDRPWSRMLLPFSDYSDSRSRFSGNPELEPEYGNSFETGYLQYWNTGSLLTSVYYRYRTGVHERVTTLDDQGIRRTQPINLATEEAWGIEFSADQDIAQSLSLTANANFYQSDSRGTYQGTELTSHAETAQGRLTLRWRPTSQWNFQFSGRYRGPRNTTQGHRDGMTMMDTGISRNFELWNGQATVSLSVDDILNSRNFQNTINNQNFYSEREFSWSSRSFMVNFQYQFNQYGNNRGDRRRGGRGDWD
ncbi:TonB-dependent receptor [Aliifodinibius sp. S!AR15-10]|uniref:outer membrane beta-barrel family protein n=1 Tax=Aliifodinibius sp. S!AR15-10 TaxID=2950437 RepID=UPI002856980D|nr:outer membrane beta-barrel family protein [Aliifodinibius sp. S!AR15-10]MDR8392443.1 TonB-dependent receptor [Aliifodinibius sp. S!AR15-10]